MIALIGNNILNLALFILLCNAGFDNKNKSNFKKTLGIICLFIASTFSIFLSQMYLPVLIRLFFLCCYSLYFYKINIVDSIFVTFSLDINTGIAEFLASRICIVLFEGEVNLNVGSAFYTRALILSSIISILLTTLFSVLLKRFKNIGDLSSNYKWTLLILPVTIFFLIMNIEDYLLTVEKKFIYIANIAALILANYVTLWLYIKLFESLKKADELQITNQNIQLQNEKYELIATNYENSFYFLHDLLHQCIRLENVYDNNYQQAKEVISNISNKVARKFNMFYTDSYPLRIVLNQYNELLENYEITLNTTILELPSFLSKVDQTFLFDKLIKISIDSCIEAQNEDRYINIHSRKQDYGAIIQCTFRTNTMKDIDLSYLNSKYYIIQKSELENTIQTVTIFIGLANK